MCYAQFDTDLALASYFADNYIGRYLDIGASYPKFMSNTYLFYERGWAGITVEPIPERFREHREQRPRDECFNLAVGQHGGVVTFYECEEEDSVSTVLFNEAKKRGDFLSWRCPILTIASILKGQPKAFDIMSIDVEGYEREVLEGCPFELPEFRPRLIVIEACFPCTEIPSYDKWEHILTSFGYAYRQTCGVNRIYEFNGENHEAIH